MKKFFVIIMIIAFLCSCNSDPDFSSSKTENSSDIVWEIPSNVSESASSISESTSSTSENTNPVSEDNKSENEPIIKKSYSLHTIESPVLIGHTGNSYFTDDYLFFTAQSFSPNLEDDTFDENTCCFFKVNLSEKKIELIQNWKDNINQDIFVKTFIDDLNNNLYYITQENVELEETYSYQICHIDQFGYALSSVNLCNTFSPITGISNDGSNYWYISTVDTVYIFDKNFSLLKELPTSSTGRISSLIRIQNDVAIVVLEDGLYKIYVLNSEKTEFLNYATLPRGTSQIFNGNSQYDFIFLLTDETYCQTLYGWKNSRNAEPLINYNDYFVDSIATINAYVDDENNIFLLTNGDFHSKSPTSNIIVFKPIKS